MSKWCALRPEEEKLLRRLGREPTGCTVNRLPDYLVFLFFKTREEFIVRIDGEEGKHGRKANAGNVQA